MDPDFTNREIKEMLDSTEKRSDAFHTKLMERMDDFEDSTNKTLGRIEDQTLRTNGSIAEINKWRERANGMGIASGVFMAMIVLPILIWSVSVLVNIRETVHDSVDEALSAYDVTKE